MTLRKVAASEPTYRLLALCRLTSPSIGLRREPGAGAREPPSADVGRIWWLAPSSGEKTTVSIHWTLRMPLIRPVGFQHSATALDLGFYMARRWEGARG